MNDLRRKTTQDKGQEMPEPLQETRSHDRGCFSGFVLIPDNRFLFQNEHTLTKSLIMNINRYIVNPYTGNFGNFCLPDRPIARVGERFAAAPGRFVLAAGPAVAEG
jgi:hypothetical protein